MRILITDLRDGTFDYGRLIDGLLRSGEITIDMPCWAAREVRLRYIRANEYALVGRAERRVFRVEADLRG